MHPSRIFATTLGVLACACSGASGPLPYEAQAVLREGKQCGSESFAKGSQRIFDGDNDKAKYKVCSLGLTCKADGESSNTLKALDNGNGICTAKGGIREACASATGCGGKLLCISEAGEFGGAGICLQQCTSDSTCETCSSGTQKGCCKPVAGLPGTGVCIQ